MHVKVLKALGGQYMLGVNFSAMHKYGNACTPQQWQHAVASLKARALQPLKSGHMHFSGKDVFPTFCNATVLIHSDCLLWCTHAEGSVRVAAGAHSRGSRLRHHMGAGGGEQI